MATSTFVSGFAPRTFQVRRAQERGLCGRHRHAAASVRMGVPVTVLSMDKFEAEVLASDLPCLVDFYASWVRGVATMNLHCADETTETKCGPCKLVAPLMDWAASEYDGKLKVAKVDTEGELSGLAKEYKINGLPTLAVFKGGTAYAVQEGAIGKAGLKEYIEKNVFE